MCDPSINLETTEYTCVRWQRSESGKFLVITGNGYKPGYMFPWAIYREGERFNSCPIVQKLFTEMLFRADPNYFDPGSVRGIIVPKSGCFMFHTYTTPLSPNIYTSNFKRDDALHVIESMKASKHIAYTLALKLAGEQGWQAMVNDHGNMPCANSMAVNAKLRGRPIDRYPVDGANLQPLTANDNRDVQGVFPQHGLAHGTNYGVTVIPTYGRGISKSIAQYNLFDFLLLWRRLYAIPGYEVNLNNPIRPPEQDTLVQKLNERQNVPNRGSIYRYSFISTYITSHRAYGGFPSRNPCVNRLISFDVHPILCIHAAYKAVLAQSQLCDFAVWMVLPFRPLFMIMIQLWHMRTGKPLGSLTWGSSWEVLLNVEENRKILENVLEKQYHLKFPDDSIKASHDCVMKNRLTKCFDQYSYYTLNSVLQSAYNYALTYTNVKKAIKNNPDNVIGSVISYAYESVLIDQESILAKPERSKYFAYVDPQKHEEHKQKWLEVLNVTKNTQDYIKDVVETELYYLIDRLPDPSTDVYPQCNQA